MPPVVLRIVPGALGSMRWSSAPDAFYSSGFSSALLVPGTVRRAPVLPCARFPYMGAPGSPRRGCPVPSASPAPDARDSHSDRRRCPVPSASPASCARCRRCTVSAAIPVCPAGSSAPLPPRVSWLLSLAVLAPCPPWAALLSAPGARCPRHRPAPSFGHGAPMPAVIAGCTLCQPRSCHRGKEGVCSAVCGGEVPTPRAASPGPGHRVTTA